MAAELAAAAAGPDPLPQAGIGIASKMLGGGSGPAGPSSARGYDTNTINPYSGGAGGLTVNSGIPSWLFALLAVALLLVLVLLVKR